MRWSRNCGEKRSDEDRQNVYAGTAMARRSAYMFGAALARTPHGALRLAQTVATGNITLTAPTLDITETGQEEIVDGVRMIFQMAPGTEAPAEFLVYFPEHKALCSAEDAMHTMHNLLTLRGALVRDPHAWSNYLPETIDMFGGETEVVFALHHWPTWGNERVVQFLSAQRDLYAYLRDQTLRLINKGWTGIEIAEELPLPPVPRKSLARPRLLRFGKPQHQSHLSALRGLYDGNPAHLWQHPPWEQGKRYVELGGGADVMVAEARESFDKGDFRWAAEILSHVVFAEPDHEPARALLRHVRNQR